MKNKLIRFVMAAVALVAANAVIANESMFSDMDNWYVSAAGSFGLNSKLKGKADANDTATKFKGGLGAGLAVGYKLSQWRFEVEGSFRRNKVKNTYANNAGVANSLNGGSLKHYNLMLNGYYDFEITEQVGAYVGAGLGWSHSKAALNTFAGDKHAKFSSNDLAAQVMAGVTYKINENWTAFAGYRLFSTINKPKYKVTTAAATAQKTKFKRSYANMVEAGVRFQF